MLLLEVVKFLPIHLMLNPNTTDDPEDLLIIYQKTPSLFYEVASRLFSLKKYGYFITLWNTEMIHNSSIKDYNINISNNSNISNTEMIHNSSNNIDNIDSRRLIQTLSLISRYSKELCDAGEADKLIRSLLDLTIIYGDTFETYKICCTVSDLVSNNRQFPSKATAILYFKRITSMLKKSNNTLSYLNGLHLLNELEPFTMSRKEFEWLKKLSNMKSEVVRKELFCGVKLRGVDSIVVGLDDGEYIDEQPFTDSKTIENVSFLVRNSINFKIEEESITVIPPTNEGFTNLIFNIANRFTIPISTGDSKSIDNSKSSNINNTDSKSSISKPATNNTTTNNNSNKTVGRKVQFKNRFTIPYKKSKLIKIYCRLDFEDTHFEERNRTRENRLTELMNKKEEERNNLIQYRSTVEDLLEELNYKIEERNEKEREEMLVRAKEEEERTMKERMSRLWRNKPELQQTERNVSAVDVNQNEGIYVSKFNTMNFTESNILNTVNDGEVYKPPSFNNITNNNITNNNINDGEVYKPSSFNNISSDVETYKPPSFNNKETHRPQSTLNSSKKDTGERKPWRS